MSYTELHGSGDWLDELERFTTDVGGGFSHPLNIIPRINPSDLPADENSCAIEDPINRFQRLRRQAVEQYSGLLCRRLQQYVEDRTSYFASAEAALIHADAVLAEAKECDADTSALSEIVNDVRARLIGV